jgi:hypothetical protein
LIEKPDILIPPQLSEGEGQEAIPSASPAVKKKFVEPEVSFPIDVLEATTFFVPVDSGVVTP